MLNDPRIWGTHLKRHEVVMVIKILSALYLESGPFDEQQQHLYSFICLVHTLIKFKKINNISVCTQLSLELK